MRVQCVDCGHVEVVKDVSKYICSKCKCDDYQDIVLDDKDEDDEAPAQGSLDRVIDLCSVILKSRKDIPRMSFSVHRDGIEVDISVGHAEE